MKKITTVVTTLLCFLFQGKLHAGTSPVQENVLTNHHQAFMLVKSNTSRPVLMQISTDQNFTTISQQQVKTPAPETVSLLGETKLGFLVNNLSAQAHYYVRYAYTTTPTEFSIPIEIITTPDYELGTSIVHVTKTGTEVTVSGFAHITTDSCRVSLNNVYFETFDDSLPNHCHQTDGRVVLNNQTIAIDSTIAVPVNSICMGIMYFVSSDDVSKQDVEMTLLEPSSTETGISEALTNNAQLVTLYDLLGRVIARNVEKSSLHDFQNNSPFIIIDDGTTRKLQFQFHSP